MSATKRAGIPNAGVFVYGIHIIPMLENPMKSFVLASLFLTPYALAADIAIAIHGGAGTITRENMSNEQERLYREALEQSVLAGYKVLEQGGSSLDAVAVSIRMMEDSALFNAGHGAVFTWDETHELDASIMDGKTRNAGAVAGVRQVKNPVDAARAVMENSVHVMLSGEGADAFAKAQGLSLVENSYFSTERRREALKRAKQTLTHSDHAHLWQQQPTYKMGTVGAVALDKDGNLAAATSTGGMTAKRWGRVGDAPIIGAGTFADNQSCAVSATGHGEYFIRYQVASDICARVAYQQKTIDQAGNEVIHGVLSPDAGEGGVIIIDRKGNIAMPFNSKGMYRASVDVNGKVNVEIYAD